MVNMGAYFEPPRRNNLKAWQVMRFLADEGYRFRTETQGLLILSIIGLRPKLREVRKEVEALKEEAEARRVRRRGESNKLFRLLRKQARTS